MIAVAPAGPPSTSQKEWHRIDVSMVAGCHRAALNMGDCFAYACARELDVPLLCKGNDFPLTDIALA